MAAIGRTIWRLPAKSCHSPRSSIYCYSENTFVTALRSNKQVEPRMPTGTIPKRGQVWWAFDERIPLVILSADGMADFQRCASSLPQAQIFKVTRSKCQ